MKFVERLTSPTKDNKYYFSDLNQYYKDGNGMPNCTCYAWGRWYELLNLRPDLSLHQAELWFLNNDSYKRGKTPKLGAVACWSQGDTYNYKDGSGHVAIVERINSDNSILCSESQYKERMFVLNNYTGNYDFNNFHFQGFIYLPIAYDTEIVSSKMMINSNIGLYLLDENGNKIGVYPNNNIVDYISDGYNKYGYHYYKVSVDGKLGYMASTYLVNYVAPDNSNENSANNTNSDVPFDNKNDGAGNKDNVKDDISDELPTTDNKKNSIWKSILAIIKKIFSYFKSK